MAKKKRDYSKDLQLLLYINFAVIILLISAFNLKLGSFTKNTFEPNKVLGKSTDIEFWQEFVKKHPTYRDAWVELDRMDKVYEIDPNWSGPDKSE